MNNKTSFSSCDYLFLPNSSMIKGNRYTSKKFIIPYRYSSYYPIPIKRILNKYSINKNAYSSKKIINHSIKENPSRPSFLEGIIQSIDRASKSRKRKK